MKLELGKTYKTADGRKVGPMIKRPGYEYIWGQEGCDNISDFHWYEDGRSGAAAECSAIIAEWDETPRVDRYDLEGILFERDGHEPSSSFAFDATPEGHKWWWANRYTLEGQARLEQMRRQWDEENEQDCMSASDDYASNAVGDVPHTIATRITLDKQVHGNVEVTSRGKVWMMHTDDAIELRQSAAVLVQMADKLEGK